MVTVGERSGATATTERVTLDPITREVISNGLTSLANEMAVVVVRTAHSQVVRDSLDFSTAVFDPAGRVVAQGLAIPLHLGAMPDALSKIMDRHAGSILDGDVFVLNDPDEGGMHLPDIFMFKAVFVDGEILGWVGCIAHHADMGGRVAGSNAVDSREIYAEGLQIPILKLYEAGVENETLSSIIARNVRLPAIVMGDIRAQLSSINVGERGMRKLVAEHGRDVLTATFDDILDYTEGIVRAEIARLPDGTYSFDDYIDDDGFGSGPIRISATVEIEGDRLHVDFEGTGGQVMSALNATTSFTRASVFAAFLCVTAETEILNNDGLYRAITVTVPEGSILNPRRPAPRAARGLTGFRVIDAVIGALHKAVPDRCFAAGEGGPTMISIGTVDPDGVSHVFVDFVCGGWGGRQTQDGVDAISPIGANLANVPVEQIERDYEIIVDEYSFLPDTGGPGVNRGCLSIVRQLRFLGDWGVLSIRSDRRDHPPYGLDGGLPGHPSLNILNPGRPDETLLPTKFTRDIGHGDVLRHVTAGGGGVGIPAGRSAGLIAHDLKEGKMTEEHARTVYGFTETSSEDRSSTGPRVHA
ncbi:MAG: hydantoinase B/oxoprolinase family protein [bacterium]|nr:hydantoinase B/oxoprolinase family protein [bacterium]